MRTATTRYSLLLVALALAGGDVGAQGFPPSQRQTIAQSVALTTVSISYGRPVARGRALWGQLVPWGAIWHPGADSATRVSIDHDITVEGKTLKQGEYSLWLIPRDGKPWTVIFSSASHVFHKPYPGDSTAVLRVDVPAESFSNVESMTIDFPKVLSDDALMRIQWGSTGVVLHIKAPWRQP